MFRLTQRTGGVRLLQRAMIGLVLAASGCAGSRVSKHHDRMQAPRRILADESVDCPGGLDIGVVLDAWTGGERDRAVGDFLAMARAGAPKACFRPYHHSEDSFISLPRHEQDVLRAEMVQRHTALLNLARELKRRALDASNAGSADRAREIIRAMRMLAEANRGAEVTLFADICGKAIAKMASEAQTAINGECPQIEGAPSQREE